MIKRVAGHLVQATVAVLVVLLVLVAVTVGLGRQLMASLEEIQPQVAEFLSDRSGLHIEFDNLRGSWKGLAPRIRVYGLRVGQQPETAPAIVARKLDLEILLLQSVLRREPRVRLTLDGALLTLAKTDGRLAVEGLTLAPPSASARPLNANRIAELVSVQPRLLIRDTRVVVKNWYEQPVVLNLQNLQVEATRRTRYMRGDVVLQGPSPLAFQVRAKLRGSLLNLSTVSGNFYLDTGTADWLPWIPTHHRHWHQAELTGLQGGTETWLQVKNGKLVDATLRFIMNSFKLNSANEVQPPDVQRLSGVAHWQQDDKGGWQAGINHLLMVTPQYRWQPAVVSLAATTLAQDDVRYGLALDEADSAPWLDYFLAIHPAEGKLYETLAALRPSGKLQHLSFFLQQKDGKLQDLRLAAQISGLDSHGWEKYPGFTNLDLSLWAVDGNVVARLQDDYLVLDYPWLFRDALELKQVDGRLALLQQSDGYLLQSSLLHLANDEVRTATQFSLEFPADPSRPPFMQLQATLRDAGAQVKSRYLPAGIIPPKLLDWLDDSILAGQLVRGDIVVHGELGPDHHDDRRVLLGFSVRDSDLRFLPDWEEPVRQGDADVIVDRGSVRAEVTKGTYFDQTLEYGTVDVAAQPAGGQHLLHVRTRTQGAADRGFAILQQTPLAHMAGEAVADMALTGQIAVDLDLQVPLDPGPKKIAAAVDVDLQQGQFRLNSRDLQVSDLAGRVHFDLENGLSASRLKGRAMEGAVNGTINTRHLKQGGQMLTLALNGRAGVVPLRNWLKLSVLEPLSGSLPYQMLMQLPLGEARSRVHGSLDIRSNLQGAALNLPEPFGKTTAEARDFRLKMTLDQAPAQLSLHYADLVDLAIQTYDGDLQKAALTLGGGKVQLPTGYEVVVNGRLSRLAPTEWGPVQERLKAASNRYGENFQPAWLRLLGRSSLRVDNLILGASSYGTQVVDLWREGDTWKMDLAGDFLKGGMQVPLSVLESTGNDRSAQPPVTIQLKRVGIPAVSEDEVVEKQSALQANTNWQPMNLSPLSLPAADILIEQLQLGQENFGRWSLKLRPQANGLAIKEINAKFKAITLTGEGLWSEVNGHRATSIRSEFHAEDIAQVMKAWGSAPTLSSNVMKGHLEWQWLGAPFEFSLARTRGPVSAAVQDGAFYNVKSGVVGKFWGVLNFETLTRRLQLNFKDLQDNDMVYDEISAHGRVDNGVLKLEELKLDSPSIRLSSSGNINLLASQLDLTMNVTVPVTRNLVLPAAVVGGVPAAAVAWTVEKFLGSQFDKLTTIKYGVKGSFDEPTVNVMESFNIIPDKISETVKPGERKSSAGKAPARSAP